jgi:hypothetical protein
LKAGLWLRRGRLVKMILLFRHLCRAQAKIPLNELSKFAGPLLQYCRHFREALYGSKNSL